MTRHPIIGCERGSFTIESGAKVEFIAGFDEIARVTAWKRDELTTDLICFEMLLTNGAQCVVHEDMPGFDALAERLAALPGFDPDWRDKVIMPPFASNEMVAYVRPEPPETS